MNKSIYFIKHKENENPGTVFEVKLLENIYIDLLKFHIICVESHVTRFSKILKENIPGLEIRNVGKKVIAFFTSTADALISELIPNCSDFYQSLLEVVLLLQKMMAPTSNTFKNSFVENLQQESTPVHLLTHVSMLIGGPGVTNKKSSQPPLTIAEFIQTNFRKNRDNELNINRRIMKERETLE